MKDILRRGFLRALGAFAAIVPAITLLPGKANALVLVDRTEYGTERANYNGIRPALQAAVIKAMIAAGFTGEIAAGYIEETDHVWARWTSWENGEYEGHVLVRAHYYDFRRDEAGYVSRFVELCRRGPLQHRQVNGLIQVKPWPTA